VPPLLARSTRARTVLLVDDPPEFLQLARGLLEAHPGLIVAGEARSGEEALTLVLRLRPEVVLLDIQLPGLSGFEVARRMRELVPDLQCILVSAFADPQYATLAGAVGARGFLAKSELAAEAVLRLLALP
jgi:DNA-binding NarL/FixJ family response regulator